MGEVVHPRNELVLELTDGEEIKKWGDADVMDCFISLNSFGWWCWDEVENRVFLYFDTKENLEETKQWIEGEYHDVVKVWKIVCR